MQGIQSINNSGLYFGLVKRGQTPPERVKHSEKFAVGSGSPDQALRYAEDGEEPLNFDRSAAMLHNQLAGYARGMSNHNRLSQFIASPEGGKAIKWILAQLDQKTQ